MVVSENHDELLPLVQGVHGGNCVPLAEDVPSVTSSQRRNDEDWVVFLVVPGLARHGLDAAAKIEKTLKCSALGVRRVQLDRMDNLARIELSCRADEALEAALVDEVRRVTPYQFVAYPVWQHRDRIVRLQVDGMRCMRNCGWQVIRALEKIPGVLHIHVDSKSMTAEVALAKGCTATEVDLIKNIRAANSRFNASIVKEKKRRAISLPGAILLNIVGMSSAINCATKVEAALRAAEGVIRATVDFENKRATIILEPESNVMEKDLIEVVRRAGPKFDASRYEYFNNDGDSRVVYLTINGMSCAKNCARKVQDALNSAHGVMNAKVDFKTKRATIFLESSCDVTEKNLIGIVHLADKKFSASVAKPISGPRTILLEIKGMSCASDCARKVEKALSAISSVESATVNFLLKRATIQLEAGSNLTNSDLIKVIRDASKTCDAAVYVPSLRPRAVMLEIEGMRCAKSCARKVQQALSEIEGVVSAFVDFKANTATVEVDPDGQFSDNDLLQAVRDTGLNFRARLVKPTLQGLLDMVEKAESSALEQQKVSDKALADAEENISISVDPDKTEAGQVTLLIGGMTCTSCSNSVENVLKQTEGVISAVVSFAAEKATICYDKNVTGIRTLVNAIEAIGYDASYVAKKEVQKALGDQRAKEVRRHRVDLLVAMGCAFPILIMMMVLKKITFINRELFSDVISGISWQTLIVAILATPVQIYAARRFHIDAWKGVRNRVLGMSFLVSMGANASYFYGLLTELGSEHPLSRAIIEYAKFISSNLDQPTGFQGVSGRGISCTIGAHKVIIGNREWMIDNGMKRMKSIVLQQATVTFQNAGKTSIYMGVDNELSALFAVADAPRSESIRTLKKLKQMGLEVWMLTGDNARTALTIADQLGISRRNVMAEVVPSQKSSKIKQLQSTGRIVAMVGDGINDSPALAQANLGISIAGGTEIAVETAGMVLMKANLYDVITALDLSRTIFNRIRLNYVWALGYNCLLIPLAAGVLFPYGVSIPPMFAGGAMAISSVSVVMSSLLLRYYSPPAPPEDFCVDDTKSLLFKKPTVTTPLLASSTLV
ncbi:hypothetical protein CCR75_004999 [Bremia lactucae]|uniref:HMA domain-containing protein n=1 Tax=Bremia lactucae TaxID=4779 RepID=A0A976FQ57_BRELC|nr:hypothetical protein CCR75_004999 [Bremia lactucae]